MADEPPKTGKPTLLDVIPELAVKKPQSLAAMAALAPPRLSIDKQFEKLNAGARQFETLNAGARQFEQMVAGARQFEKLNASSDSIRKMVEMQEALVNPPAVRGLAHAAALIQAQRPSQKYLDEIRTALDDFPDPWPRGGTGMAGSHTPAELAVAQELGEERARVAKLLQKAESSEKALEEALARVEEAEARSRDASSPHAIAKFQEDQATARHAAEIASRERVALGESYLKLEGMREAEKARLSEQAHQLALKERDQQHDRVVKDVERRHQTALENLRGKNQRTIAAWTVAGAIAGALITGAATCSKAPAAPTTPSGAPAKP